MNETNPTNLDSLPILPGERDASGEPAGRRCCGFTAFLSPRHLMIGLCVAMTTSAIGTAAYFAGVASEARQQGRAEVKFDWSDLPIANATAAVTSKEYSMATGPMSEGTEALFVLDHNSGLLQCSVIYPRLGRFMATFTANVADALGAGAKGGQYIMTTGTADFPRSSSNPAGFSVIYVLDTATGNYACYGVPFDRVSMNANRPQQGLMVLISQGSANPVIDRDELR